MLFRSITVPDTLPFLADGVETARASVPSDFFPDELGFVQYDGPADVGWTRKGSGFVAPPAPVLPAPAVRIASNYKLRCALNASGQRPAWDAALGGVSADTRDYWTAEPNPPETSPKLRRIATAASVDLKALFDQACA